MSEPFIGEIRLVGFNFAPRGWASCDGQLLPIAQNTALFSLLGTTYGGDGRVTFALPDLRGRCAIGDGQGPGLSPVRLGEVGGRESVTLTASELPPHAHQVQPVASTVSPTVSSPEGAMLTAGVSGGRPAAVYAPAGSGNTRMAAFPTDNAGNGQPVSVRPPYLGMNYVIALMGIYPSRD